MTPAWIVLRYSIGIPLLVCRVSKIPRQKWPLIFTVILQKLDIVDERLSDIEKQLDDQKYFAIIG